MRVLLISTYELGHQPLHVASPAARLRAAGHEVRALDLSVEDWDDERADWAEAAAVSVPMHTAMRLGVACARRLRERRPGVPVAFYGLYAPVAREHTAGLADRIVAGEYEAGLVGWVDELAGRQPARDLPVVQLGRGREPFLPPARELLPSPDRYAHLSWNGEHRVAAAVEATHGCRHRCRHCPVPTVYDGQFRVVPVDTVLADVERLVAAGVRHLTFGDPDFLNGPGHALAVTREVHAAFPDLTFDVTVKVEHALRHAKLWPELAAAGLLFVVSAFESVDDATLEILDKGHTAADMSHTVTLLRDHGIDVRPSWMPFTPWTTRATLADILDFTVVHDLIASTDPVQFSIRLLLPDGSLLLDHPAMRPHLGDYDPERLTWTWTHPDADLDVLQGKLARLVEERQAGAAHETFLALAREVAAVTGGPDLVAAEAQVQGQIDAGSTEGRPRLTEPWFC